MSLRDLDIHPDITRALTPSATLYTSSELQDILREDVFRRSWQWVGDRDWLKDRGLVHPVNLLPGYLDEALVLSSDAEGQRRILSNVCTHRGALVCQAAGARGELRCRYHGRRFGLDGAFLQAPEFEDACDFPRAVEGLAQLPLEALGPLLFTSLDPRVSFSTWLGSLSARMIGLPLAQAHFTETGTQDYEVQANWALYCENYLEGFHIPYVHPTLSKALDWRAYDIRCFEWGSVQLAYAAEDALAFELPPEHPDHGSRIAAFYIWLFPNLMLNLYPWGLSLNVVEPKTLTTCRVRFRRYVWAPELQEQGAGSGLDQVELEDEEVVQSVQQGLTSRLYPRGRYAPRHEQAVHHFHRLLQECLTGA